MRTRTAALAFSFLVLAACERAAEAPPVAVHGSGDAAPAQVSVPKGEIPEIWRAVHAPDRSEEDRKLDDGRKPLTMLEFFGIAEGMHVAELGAGVGYTAELLARTVGPKGVVWGHNPPFVIERFGEHWIRRLTKPVMQNVHRVDRDWDDPFPGEARDLDAVLIVLFYHDTVWMNANRDAMNAAVFHALKPGGVYGVIDHSARPGDGLDVVKSLHRIEEGVVKKEILSSGFRLIAEARFLRNSDDTRDWNAAPSAAAERRGSSDRFVYKFVKP